MGTERTERDDVRETRIIPSLIKAQSRCFDPSAIRKLALRHLNISKIEGLYSCTNLVVLDLSFNNIASIDGLATLPKLSKLILSNNKLTTLEGLGEKTNAESLRDVFLDGNCISNINDNDKNELSKLINLRRLVFKRPTLGTSNPICELPNYREIIYNCAPRLVFLDTVHAGYYDPDLESDVKKPNEQHWDPELQKTLWRRDMKFQEAFGDGKLEVSKFEVVVKDSKKLVADSETVLEHYKQKYL